MYRETGVYVFPEGKNITSYLFTHHENGDSLSTNPKTRYTEQLFDILEADMSSLEELTNECLAHKKDIIDPQKTQKMITAIGDLVLSYSLNEHLYGFLLYIEMEAAGVFKTNSDDELIKVIDEAVDILYNMLRTRCILFVLTESYCRYEGTHEEKFNHFCSKIDYLTDLRFEQVVVSEPLDLRSFLKYDLTVPYSYGYRIETLEEYMWFIFINAMKEDNHISQCQYCGHFFIPKTKRKTRYCDRQRTDAGLTCKQVGPSRIHRALAENDTIMNEYQKAINRNYKRWERYNMHLDDKKKGKDISYDEYCEWMKRLLDSKQKFYSGDITKEEFLSVIKELG